LPQRIGEYEVLECVGQGGTGVVYRARHVTLRRIVALKVLHGGALRAGAEALARLQHPHLVQLFEVGEHDDGTGAPRPYLVREFVDGDSLAARLAGGPLSPRQAAGWLEPLARGIHHAHEHGWVHGDLKPSHVLLNRDGRPKVCDLGVARRQEASADFGPAADIHALGALLDTLLTGAPGTLDRVRPQVPRDLETICRKCLEKEPHRRYATALALADDLRRFRAGEPIAARPPGPLGRALAWVRRQTRQHPPGRGSDP
ncbi:MAG TPA: serine/threonine-protein kinase, partial [Gemmataceae bacterium]|nr:serine/threonine-protein kinase [Gemmataceae bacterium]